MNRCTAWCVPLATLAFASVAHAADPGFYFGATASRVEHDVDNRPGFPTFAVIGFSPTPVLPPGGIISRPPPIGIVPITPPFAIGPTSVDVDDVDTGFSVTVGYRINRYFAAELSYIDFGEYQQIEHYSTGSAFRYTLGVSGPSVSVLGSVPLGERWEVFARGGVLFADQEVSVTDLARFAQDFSDEVIMAGAGVQWSFAPRWAVRLEYQVTDDLQYDNTGESSIDQASLSVLFKL